MSQILLIETDESLIKILKLNMASTLECEVFDKANGKDAISLMNLIPIDLIICRWDLSKEILNHLEKSQGEVKILVVGKKNSTYPHFYNLDSEIKWENIMAKAARILGKGGDEPDPAEREYIGVSIQYFYMIPAMKLNCDIFIRVKKNEVEYQFIKRFHATEEYTNAELDKYKAQGLKQFYLQRDKFKYFVNKFTDELSSKVEDMSLQGTDRIKVTSQAYELGVERLHSIGIDEHTIDIVDNSIKSMHTALGEENAMANFLKLLKKNSVSYAYSHAYLTSLILHKIIQNFDWESGLIREKLTYIAFFHDISLADSELMKINHQEELDESEIQMEEKTIVFNHAMNSAKMVEKFPNVPAGVTTVIKEHHGTKNGVGFADGLNTTISPLSQMFIVVEDFVDSFLKSPNPTGSQIAEIFEKLEARYNKLTYQQTLKALMSMLQNKKR